MGFDIFKVNETAAIANYKQCIKNYDYTRSIYDASEHLHDSPSPYRPIADIINDALLALNYLCLLWCLLTSYFSLIIFNPSLPGGSHRQTCRNYALHRRLQVFITIRDPAILHILLYLLATMQLLISVFPYIPSSWGLAVLAELAGTAGGYHGQYSLYFHITTVVVCFSSTILHFPPPPVEGGSQVSGRSKVNRRFGLLLLITLCSRFIDSAVLTITSFLSSHLLINGDKGEWRTGCLEVFVEEILPVRVDAIINAAVLLLLVAVVGFVGVIYELAWVFAASRARADQEMGKKEPEDDEEEALERARSRLTWVARVGLVGICVGTAMTTLLLVWKLDYMRVHAQLVRNLEVYEGLRWRAAEGLAVGREVVRSGIMEGMNERIKVGIKVGIKGRGKWTVSAVADGVIWVGLTGVMARGILAKYYRRKSIRKSRY